MVKESVDECAVSVILFFSRFLIILSD